MSESYLPLAINYRQIETVRSAHTKCNIQNRNCTYDSSTTKTTLLNVCCRWKPTFVCLPVYLEFEIKLNYMFIHLYER